MTPDVPIYNSRILNSFLTLIRKKYRQVDLEELFSYSGIKECEVREEGHWFTQSQIDRFHEKLEEILGFDISREAGRHAAARESTGVLVQYVAGLIGPAHTFLALKHTAAKVAKSCAYDSRRLAENKVEVTVTPLPGVEEKPFQCENRIGFFEAIPLVFNFKIPRVEHTECIFEGGHCCRYIVSWEKSRAAQLRTLRNRLTPLIVAACAAAIHFCSWNDFLFLLSSVAALFMTTSYVCERLDKVETTAALASLRASSDDLLDQITVNYDNARLVNEVGQAISKQAEIDEVLENVVMAVEKRLGYDRCLLLLADDDKTSLRFRTGFGYEEDQLAVLKEMSFSLSDPDSKGVFVVSFREQRPILVEDFSELTHLHSQRSILFSERMHAQSFICCAIVCEGESLGVFAVDNVRTRKKLQQSDVNLLAGVAPVIGMSIRNATHADAQRRMAEQLRQSQKIEAVGQLAGGVAHDFNNLLTAIMGFTHLSQMSLGKDDPAQSYLQQVEHAAERASGLTQGLLAFSRKQINNPQPVDLNLVVESIKKLLSRLITAEIELDVAVTKQQLYIMADAGQIDQVMVNLVTNARDAMSGAGVLTIRTFMMEMTQQFIDGHGYGAVGSYAVLSVSDTGAGMDEETMAHIFEPFYTTKELGRGTGLGMSIVYGIVKQHEGYLEIQTEQGKGTTFNVYLPLLKKPFTVVAREDVTAGSYEGTETVLVAEDAPEVRKLTTEVLRQSGYKVIEAVDGREAVQKFAEEGKKVDLVIMDVVMPKMNGKDAFCEIKKMSPRTKVLFTSGYRPDDVKSKGITFAKENFLPKPSSPQMLLKKVRELLAA